MPESKAPEERPERPADVPEQDQEVNAGADVCAEEPENFNFDDRAMIRCLCGFISMANESGTPDHDRVKLARDWSLIAAYERIQRICKNDIPIYDDESLFPVEGDE